MPRTASVRERRSFARLRGGNQLFRALYALPSKAGSRLLDYGQPIEGCCDLLEAGFLPGKKDPSPAEIKAALAGAMRPAYAKA